jgi:2,4-dienoyl-CoA reductase (NADPH2)
MYSAEGGQVQPWHLLHYGARAAGGVGLVMVEASAVNPRGRITPHDLGIWSDDHLAGLRQLSQAIGEHGAASAIQIAHAGRKASTHRPWGAGSGAVSDSDGGWPVVGPTHEPFSERSKAPQALTIADIEQLVSDFATAAARADAAAFDVVEIHAAHGYLLHSFLSPLSNHRQDVYGGDFAGRSRFLREVVVAVRDVWPEGKPLFVRISASDWMPGGWGADDSVALARELRPLGVDLVDCSSGGAVMGAVIPSTQEGYQVPFAAQVRREAGIASGAVGRILSPAQAEAIVAAGEADLVLLGKPLLEEPHWAIRAARELGADAPWPAPYGWVFKRA